MDLNRVERVDNQVVPKNALISVADKSGVDSFLKGLWKEHPRLAVYSSGGTYRILQAVADSLGKSDQLKEVSSYTGQPEMQGGLVKTLDYRIYLGILSETYNPDHQRDLTNQNAVQFDLVVCNFYPFEKTAAEEGITVEDLRTHIDIGGPTMLRGAAKNFLRVIPLHDPEDYGVLLKELRDHHGATTLPFRAALSAKAFRYTAHYENAIAGALGSFIRQCDWPTVYTMEQERDT